MIHTIRIKETGQKNLSERTTIYTKLILNPKIIS